MTLLAYIVAIGVLFTLDAIWLTLMKMQYGKWVRSTQGMPLQIRAIGAAASYTFVLVMLLLIVFPAALAHNKKDNVNNAIKAIRWGSVSGLAVYGVFNATNYAMFSGYPWQMAVIDTLWGGLLFGIVTFAFLQLS